MGLYFRALPCLDNCIEAHICTSHYICARCKEVLYLYPVENVSFGGKESKLD